MIEPTDEQMDEMVDVFRAAWNAKATELAAAGATSVDGGVATRAGLLAAFEVLARDRCMEARGHVYHPLAAPRVWDSKRRPSWTEGAPHLPDCPCVHCGIKRPDGEP